MLIPNETINKINDEVDIVELVNEYVPLKKAGGDYVGLCPFHDDHDASLHVKQERHCFTCFACKTTGSAIKFVQLMDNIPFTEACVKVGKRIGINIETRTSKKDIENKKYYDMMEEANKFYKYYLLNSDEGKEALEYLKKRDIPQEIIDKFELGLAPAAGDYLYQVLKNKNFLEFDMISLGLVSKNENREGYHDVFQERIVFPIKNEYGKIVGFNGRIFKDSKMARYLNSKDSKIFTKGNILYNLDKAKSSISKTKAIIMEGGYDVFAAAKAGMENVIATLGTSLTPKHVELLLSKTKNIVICYDGDRAGISSMVHCAIIFSKYNVTPEAIVLPDQMDPDEYYKKYGKEALVEYFNNNTKNIYVQIYDLYKKDFDPSNLDSIENFKNNMFTFLKQIEVPTIVNFYLKKVADDLQIDEQSIRYEYDNLRINVRQVNQNQNNNYNQNQPPQNNQNYPNDSNEIDYTGWVNDNPELDSNYNEANSDVEQTLPKVKKEHGLEKVKRAYEYIIYYAINNNTAAKTYFDETSLYYPGPSFSLEYSIMCRIKDCDFEFYDGHIPGTLKDYVYNCLTKDENMREYISNIFSNEIYKKFTLTHFKECVNTVVKYTLELQYKKLYKAYKNGQKECYEAMMKIQKEIKKR